MNDHDDKQQKMLMDRIQGAILGIFIGDALGMGVHWQYDLEKLQRDRGYVTDYLDPLPNTYHYGKLRAGQLEQQGIIDKLLLESLADHGQLDQGDFWNRFETVILHDSTMDGTRHGGRYGWTDKSICDIYQCRVREGKPWKDCTPPRSDTPDAIVRAALIAALYYQTPNAMANQVHLHASAATGDSSVQAHAVAFASMVAAVIQGVPLDKRLRDFLYPQAGRSLPYSSILSDQDWDPDYGPYTEPDSLLWFGSIAQGIQEFNSTIHPAHRGVLLYGQFCAFFATLPSAYYCTARFPENFESAVLCSVNGGGQNTMRTSLVGALVGARVGLSKIPRRFLEGLEDSDHLVELATRVAYAAVNQTDPSDNWFWPPETAHAAAPIGSFPRVNNKNSDNQHVEQNLVPMREILEIGFKSKDFSVFVIGTTLLLAIGSMLLLQLFKRKGQNKTRAVRIRGQYDSLA